MLPSGERGVRDTNLSRNYKALSFLYNLQVVRSIDAGVTKVFSLAGGFRA